MIDYPLSPISLGGFRILAFAVNFENGRSVKLPSDLNVTIEFNVDATQEKSEKGVNRCTCVLSLECEVATVAENGEEAKRFGRINAKFAGVASGRFGDNESESAIHDTLEANVVSFLYGKARTYIELVTTSCPGGIISLPAIMPTAKEAVHEGDARE